VFSELQKDMHSTTVNAKDSQGQGSRRQP